MEHKHMARPTETMARLIAKEYPFLRFSFEKVHKGNHNFPLTKYEKAVVRSFVRDTISLEGYTLDNDAFEDALVIAATELTPKEDR